LGNFSPINPTILASDGMICEHCNSVVFSALETEFIEDSREGITGQMLNLTGSNSVRVRGNNVTMECLSGMSDNFFDDIFPFLRKQGDKFMVFFKPQVKVRNYGGEKGFQVFSLDALQGIRAESNQSKTKLAEFNSVKERLRMSGKNNIALFTGGNGPDDHGSLDQAIKLLNEYGVTYRERERKFAPIKTDSNSQYELKMQCTVTLNICRFIAKVAFNYFGLCALQEKLQTILYNPRFDQIRHFILGDMIVRREDVVAEMSDDPITYHEKESGHRFVGHIIVFYQEDGMIYSRLSFFGAKVYKVLLGEAPTEFLDDNFGCGHLFFPFDRSIHNLTQQPKMNPTETEIKRSFGLFRRIDLSGKSV
jgi:hypothetical protein